MLVEINWEPTNRQLRQFGLAALIALPLSGWLWSGGNLTVSAVLASAGAALTIAALVRPRWLRPAFIALSLIAAPIGIVVGEVVLALIYVGLFLPIGTAFRLIGRDVLQRNLDRQRASYWEDKTQPPSVASYYRQW